MHYKGLYINEFYDLVFIECVLNLELNIQARVFWSELVTVVVRTMVSWGHRDVGDLNIGYSF